jgi:hypothetical protein
MKRPFILILIIGLPLITFGWGAKGHRMVASIAKKCLGQPIIDSVDKYLNGMSWEDAAVWMDEIRSDSQYDYLKPWHYVNVERDKTYVKANEANVVEAIRNSMATLKSRKNGTYSGLNFELKVLFHLVGDIHQPLHCGYAEDKGGNTINVTFLGEATNLHKVWDTELINAAGITLNDCLKKANEMTAEEKKKIQTADVEVWVKESRELLKNVYDFDKNIKQDYVDKNKPVVETQLAKAGIRLAMVLHDAFSKARQ